MCDIVEFEVDNILSEVLLEDIIILIFVYR